jgi:hypothetical protein
MAGGSRRSALAQAPGRTIAITARWAATMPTLCQAYSDEAHPREAVDHLLASGAPRRAIRLLTGSPTHDVRDERVGTFAGAIDPDAPVGRFAGPPRRRRQGAGGFAGNPDHQRKGSFADVDRALIVTFGRGEHPHVATHRELTRLLSVAMVDGEPAERLVDELHHGHGLVVAELAQPAA